MRKFSNVQVVNLTKFSSKRHKSCFFCFKAKFIFLSFLDSFGHVCKTFKRFSNFSKKSWITTPFWIVFVDRYSRNYWIYDKTL